MLTVSDAAAVISGYSWSKSNLTFGFPDSISDYPKGYDRSVLGGLTALPEAGRDAVRQVFDLFDSYLDISFTESDPDRSWPDLATASFSGVQVAQAYLPTGDGFFSGDLLINTELNYLDALNNVGEPIIGGYAWNVLVHELGHGLGLKHLHETGADGTVILDLALDGIENSVMSYRSVLGEKDIVGYSNETWGYPQTAMVLDISGLQQIYGANYTTAATDSVYTFDIDSGEVLRNDVSLGLPGNVRTFLTIWDGGGEDTVDLSGYDHAVRIDLTPGGGVDLDVDGNLYRARLGTGEYASQHIWFSLLHENDTRSYIENAFGGTKADEITGNAWNNDLFGGSGDDTLSGGIGNDRLFGGFGRDVLDGGDNSDELLVDGFDVVIETGTIGYDKAQITNASGDTLRLDGWSGVERVNGNVGADVIDATGIATALLLFGNDGDDKLTGGAGADVLIGGNGDDTLIGGAGNDIMLGSAGSDTFEGGGGKDIFLIGSSGDSVTNGGSGFDRALINEAAGVTIAIGDWLRVERVVGYTGNDQIDGTGLTTGMIFVGNSGNDGLTGGSGDDRFFGGTGNDTLVGGGGQDALIGSGGQDRIDGGAGDDFYLGGADADTFAWSDGFGRDVVKDFVQGTDILDFGAMSGVTDLSDLKVAQVGANTVLTLFGGGGDSITLAGFDSTTLQVTDFDFI